MELAEARLAEARQIVESLPDQIEALTHALTRALNERNTAESALEAARERRMELFNETLTLKADLAQARASLAKALAVVVRLVESPLDNDEFGAHCHFCSWTDSNFDATPEHDKDCLVNIANDLAAGGEVQGAWE